MVNQLNFKLKYSRFSIIFQFFIGLGLAALFYQLIPILWWLVAVCLLFISFIFFLKRPQLAQIAYLDQKLWSLSFHSEQTISRVEILKIIDYQIFVVVYFEGDKTLTSVIWFDQMSLSQWKQLKTLEKFY
ncbi:hypothetical protein [Acinetobacter seifertii]|uniref:Uncharacterized protein n=1 Tax=Acinetobacter seifertii TaxID=1530123 RepID=A0A7H2P6Q8_9GAMM|nr:hypothetical protein [Acinetobacter seifertii]MBZ6532906.1 hypothetical protein [Acinetobacter seifertii]QNW91850.1 hypothetical protein IC799_02280 [Acinetobacter seifertii]QNW98540.1 hypothetical protein IC797_02390 [Acinetobacter seifertii]QNX71898.1 hypothetical protein IC776_15975 [Acinetobacter seifertii]